MEIVTSRLRLRTAQPGDLAAIHAIMSRPEAMRWWSTPPHETPDQTRVWLDSMIANGPDHPDFVIEFDGQVIGKAGFWAPPDIGYILHPDYWGKGLASEALKAAIDHMFADQTFDVLTADVDPGNAASIRLLDRLGFVKTGQAERTMRVGDTWVDSVYYGLQRHVWESRRKA
ncbi:GNAT family N-acetyltransferase [uncultured Brevundimonas sp.]|uniref:GNAT family N-acetyltransferase n=1 Tax=uncultured Brevundimonas sp. TaxID=213418 RepID=UPI0030EB78F6|tara:strand:+ start:8224 stop:8739 length:516 start_codon:yes stop_codon:yes gene_type:complete